MKVKRYKHAKKVLSFYKNAFKIREPYQVIGKPHTQNFIGYFPQTLALFSAFLHHCQFFMSVLWCNCYSGRYVLPGGAERKDPDKGTTAKVPGRQCPTRYHSTTTILCEKSCVYPIWLNWPSHETSFNLKHYAHFQHYIWSMCCVLLEVPLLQDHKVCGDRAGRVEAAKI